MNVEIAAGGQIFSVHEDYETEQVEKKMEQLSPKDRGWINRGLEWKYFKPGDIVHNYSWIERVLSVVDTAVHEMGHVYMIKRGGTFISATVKAASNYLGLTRGVPDSTEDWMRSCAGGLAGEEADGQNDHRGTRSDMFQLEMAAQFSPTLSASEAKSQARSIIYPVITSLRRDALGLAINETIAA